MKMEARAVALVWCMQSHHKPREGPFELNDIFAIINAGPAIGLLAYGFFFPGLVPAVCFGAVRPRTAPRSPGPAPGLVSVSAIDLALPQAFLA